mmetsp:Transcript_44270/g.87367  ORF Transcript_44270/g.87367 Transcript_44270/m.87367 type:complete len:99 (+) Transcript_44270:169-465(+)
MCAMNFVNSSAAAIVRSNIPVNCNSGDGLQPPIPATIIKKDAFRPSPAPMQPSMASFADCGTSIIVACEGEEGIRRLLEGRTIGWDPQQPLLMHALKN